jgi:DNA adenine methylase
VIQPLKYHGGKNKLAKQFVAMMPPHTRYVEAFAGGLSVLLNKPYEGVSEYANDINGDLINFWDVLSNVDAFYRFRRIVEAIPLSQEYFEFCTNSPAQNTGSHIDYAVAKAVRYFVTMRMSRQGIGKDYCTPTKRIRRGMNENVSAWLSAVDGLPEVHERLRRVELLSKPAVEVIKKLDSPDTLFFCDPPYLHETRSSTGEYGVNEMSDLDHVDLLDCLSQVKGKFMLCGYKSKMYETARSLYGWHLTEFDVANSASGAKEKDRKTECVWTNFEVTNA